MLARLLSAKLVAVPLLALIACGGDDSPADPGGTAGSGAAPTGAGGSGGSGGVVECPEGSHDEGGVCTSTPAGASASCIPTWPTRPRTRSTRPSAIARSPTRSGSTSTPDAGLIARIRARQPPTRSEALSAANRHAEPQCARSRPRIGAFCAVSGAWRRKSRTSARNVSFEVK